MSLGERGRWWGVSAGVGNNYSSGEGDRRYFSACWLLLIPSEVLRGGREDGYPPQTKAFPEEEKDHVEMQLSDGESHYCPLLDCPGSYGQSLWPIRFTSLTWIPLARLPRLTYRLVISNNKPQVK